MQSVLPEKREDKRHNEDQGIRGKRKHEETMMSEEKKKRQCLNICMQNQKHFY